ncbi:hypothetical protein RRG08_045050 [Elysia crispata]|uniref:Uncharacterized protein n=1 Tax=Elysia crispata TaxID=231223 RepID=A0AAE1CM87_9GAST|nr:hypothetical protein RRG08_045050 [Elysia crispata]
MRGGRRTVSGCHRGISLRARVDLLTGAAQKGAKRCARSADDPRFDTQLSGLRAVSSAVGILGCFRVNHPDSSAGRLEPLNVLVP